MKYLKLTQNQKTKVDNEDYEWLSQWKWCAIKNKYGYRASRTATVNGKSVHVALSRWIMNCPIGLVVDHINRNPLDNRRCNLRICTEQQNHWNRNMNTDNKSGYRGVSWNTHAKQWCAEIRCGGKKKTLGYSRDPKKCYEMYKEARKKLFGDFLSEIF